VPGFIPLTPAALRLRSAGAHFVRRPVGLASALCASEGIHHHGCSGSENGLSEAKKAVRPEKNLSEAKKAVRPS